MASTFAIFGTGRLSPCRARVRLAGLKRSPKCSRPLHPDLWHKGFRARLDTVDWWSLMPYTLHPDNVGSDARWVALAKLQEIEGAPNVLELTAPKRRAYLARVEMRRRMLIAAHFLMSSESALVTDDGYLTQEAALECAGEPWILRALLTPACEKPPLLHSKGQKCGEKNCIDASPPWRDGYEFRLCAFLKRNPSKAEKERNDSQNADRRDQVLKARVLERDGAFCRYCRSGPLSNKATRAAERRKVLQLDHPDPDRPAGKDAGNYVVACAGCNEFKGHRTPFEAGMELLPVPTAAELAEWTDRGLTLFERPSIDPPTTIRINDEPATNQRHVADPVVDPDTGPVAGSDAGSPADARPETGPEQPNHQQEQPREGVGSGRVGQPAGGTTGPPLGALGQPPRDPDSPDIWTGRSRAPEPRAGPP